MNHSSAQQKIDLNQENTFPFYDNQEIKEVKEYERGNPYFCFPLS